MNEKLERKLEEEFSFMRKKASLEEQKANGKIDDIYSAFGCACNDGWFDLIVDLCTEIEEVYKKANIKPDIIVEQIKEKFGTLRFYFSFEGKRNRLHAIDFLGVGSIRYMQTDNSLHKEIAQIVKKYEKKSGEVCEVCGERGRLQTDLPWVLTLCDKCKSERINKRQ